VSQLGRSIDELKVDFFVGGSGGLGQQTLSEHDDSLLGSDDASLNHDEVVVNNSVVGESSHGGDLLIGQVHGGGGVVALASVTDSVHLLVKFGSVVVTSLSGSGDCEPDSSGMPSSDTTDLSVTSVCLLLQMLNSESLDDSFESLTLGDSDNVDHLVLVEDGVDSDFLFE